MSKIKDNMQVEFNDSEYFISQYTPWRKFLSMVGLISLICTPFAVWYLVHLNSLVQICIGK